MTDTLAPPKTRRSKSTATPVEPKAEAPAAAPAPAAATDAFYQLIELDRIEPSKTNPRKAFRGLEEMADSMRAHGVLEPLLARPTYKTKRPCASIGRHGFRETLKNFPGLRDSFIVELVAGERRFRAAKIAGLEVVPVIVRELDDRAVLEIQVIENDQRDDVQPLDQAHGYRALIERGGYDVPTLAVKIGRSEAYVYQRLQLTRLIKKYQDWLSNDTIHLGHAVLLARLQERDQEKLLTDWIFQGMAQGHSSAPTVNSLREKIAHTFHLNLKSAVFPKDDPNLVKNCPVCTSCSKRTGSNPSLWADIGKEDICTDPACYRTKERAFVQLQVKKAEAKSPDVIRVSVNAHNDKKNGVLGRGSYEILSKQEAKKTPAAQIKTAVVIDANQYDRSQKPGQVVQIRVKPADSGRNGSGGVRQPSARQRAEAALDDAMRKWATTATDVLLRAMKADPMRFAALAMLDHIDPFADCWNLEAKDVAKHKRTIDRVIRADDTAIAELAVQAAKSKRPHLSLLDDGPTELFRQLIDGWQLECKAPPRLEDFLEAEPAKTTKKKPNGKAVPA